MLNDDERRLQAALDKTVALGIRPIPGGGADVADFVPGLLRDTVPTVLVLLQLPPPSGG